MPYHKQISIINKSPFCVQKNRNIDKKLDKVPYSTAAAPKVYHFIYFLRLGQYSE